MWNSNLQRLQKSDIVWSAFNNGGNECFIRSNGDILQQLCCVVDHTVEDFLADANRYCAVCNTNFHVRVMSSAQLTAGTVEYAFHFKPVG